MKKYLLFVILLLAFSIQQKAQTSWLLAGNNTGAAQFLGTTTATDIRFRTSNTQRMVLTSTGNLGLGIAAPTSLLHLSRTTGSLGNLFRTDGLTSEVSQWQLFTGPTLSTTVERYRLWTDNSAAPFTNAASLTRGFRWFTDGTFLSNNVRMQLNDQNGTVAINGFNIDNTGHL